MTPADMPPDTDIVAILLETASHRLSGVGWGQVWKPIGVNTNRGCDFLISYARAVDLAIWFTLRHAALGE